MQYKSIKSQVQEGRVSCSRNHQCVLHAIASLSRRDVDFPRRDVNFTCLCHVATWTSHVATSVFTSLCHVATLPITSRRCPSRRDVSFYKPLSRRDVAHHVATLGFTSLCHVATSPPHVATLLCFKPKNGSFLALHLTHSPNRNPSFPVHQPSPDLPEPSFTLVGDPYIVLRPPLCSYESPSVPGFGSLWNFHHIVLGSSLRAFSVV